MIPVATSAGVTVSCPMDGRYAFYNSPYPAHQLSTGIDIYPAREFDETTPSPVRGEVILIRRVKSPRGRGFEDSGYDVVTLLGSLEDPKRVIKLLHVEPVMGCGDTVETGHELGRLLRSGYYGFATSPHVHVEIRDPSDPLRVRGGHQLRRLLDIGEVEAVEELRGIVTRSTSEFSMVSLEGFSASGLPADVGGIPGLLDGGIPYYGWLGAHIGDNPPRDDIITLMGKAIAKIREVHDRVCLADCLDFTVRVDGRAILGLSLRLSPGKEAELKLVPSTRGALKLVEGTEVSLSIG